jgi:hypothetical protein
MHHTGWVCTRPAPVGTTANTIMLFAVVPAQRPRGPRVAVPEFVDGGSDHKRQISTLTSSLASWIHSQMNASHYAVENRLL